jgi:hypothetical protein
LLVTVKSLSHLSAVLLACVLQQFMHSPTHCTTFQHSGLATVQHSAIEIARPLLRAGSCMLIIPDL